MKKIVSYLLMAAVIISFSGCKKDSSSNTPAVAVYGLWQITSSTLYPDLKYVRFATSKTLTAYSQTAEGLRSVIITNFSPTADQFVGNFQGAYYPASVYNYTISGDVLTVVGDNGQTSFVATKSTSTDPDNWATDVTSNDHIDNLFTNNDQGIGYDGNNLLFADYTNGKIVKVSLATRSVVSDITVASSLNTVEYDGTNFWVSRNGWNNVTKVDNTGSTLFTSATADMEAWLYGIGYVSPTSLICYSGNGQAIYNYNPTTDAVTGTKLFPNISLGDLAVSNGKVYIAQRGGTFIYRLDPVTFAVEKTYRVPEANGIYGIASVGTNNFWLNTNGGKNVLKVTLN